MGNHDPARLVFYLAKDRRPAAAKEFETSAARIADRVDGVVYGVNRAYDIMQTLELYPRIEGLWFVCHGTTRALLRPGRTGIHASWSRTPEWYSLDEFAAILAPRLTDGAIVSLCACLTGRSPRWFLRRAYGKAVSTWGPRSYIRGGEKSFAFRLRDALAVRGATAHVKAHTAAGHCTKLALARVFEPTAGTLGRSLYEIVTEDPTGGTVLDRRKWVRTVTGSLAERWMVSDPAVIEDIRGALS